jgi:hypothetical protein
VSRKRFFQVLWLIGLLMLVFLCFKVTDTTIQISADNSSYSVARNGGKVYYLLMRKLGYKVERLENKLASIGEKGAALIILVPQASISEGDADWCRQFIVSGGTVLIADEDDNEIFRRFGIVPYRVTASGAAEEVIPIPSPVTGGAQKVLISTSSRLKFSTLQGDSREIIIVDEKGVIMAEVRHGKGRLIVSTAPEIFSNELIQKEDNSLLAVNCINSAPGGRPVFVDEFHHGFRDRQTLLQSLDVPAKYLLFQILCLIFLVFLRSGMTFQSPLPYGIEERRKPLDFINTMAALYQRAEARIGILSVLYFNCRRNLARSMGLASEMDNEQLARSYSGEGTPEETELRLTLAECEESIKQGAIDDKRLLKLARKLHSYEKGEVYE